MSTNPGEPEKLTETEAKGGSKTLANRNVMIVSIVVVVIAFIILLLIYR